MEKPKRYDLDKYCGSIEEDDEGIYVLYEDYKKLKEKYDAARIRLSWINSPDRHGS